MHCNHSIRCPARCLAETRLTGSFVGRRQRRVEAPSPWFPRAPEHRCAQQCAHVHEVCAGGLTPEDHGSVSCLVSPSGASVKQPEQPCWCGHSSILAWRILWTEKPGGLQSMGSQRIGRNWAANSSLNFPPPSVGRWGLQENVPILYNWPHVTEKGIMWPQSQPWARCCKKYETVSELL